MAQTIRQDEMVGGKDLEKRTAAALTDIIYKAIIFIFVFILFTINLLAVSLSLQCNEGRDIFFKLSSAMFAFMFGIFYIIVNYLSYKINMRRNPCLLNSHNPFPFSSKEDDLKNVDNSND